MSANSFVCGSFPSHEFIKGRPDSKGGKSTYLYAQTAAEENFRERNRKMKLSTVAANSRSDEFNIGVILVSAKNDRLERLWNNSQNLKDHTPTG